MARPTNAQLAHESDLLAQGAKACRKCGQVLALSAFGRRSRTRDGYTTRCRSCTNEQNREVAKPLTDEQKAQKYARTKADRAANPEKWRQRALDSNARKYGLKDRAEYDALMARPCAICGEASEHLDHCHGTGTVRGPLCRACNHLLGNAKDNPATLRAAANYLERTS